MNNVEETVTKDYYYYLTIESLSHQHWKIVSHWKMSDSKSPEVSRTLLSILADFDNAVVWIVSTPPLISKSSSPCNNALVTVPSASITIGITVTFMFHSFSVLYQGLGTLFAFFQVYSIVGRNGKVQYLVRSLFFFFFFFFFYYY